MCVTVAGCSRDWPQGWFCRCVKLVAACPSDRGIDSRKEIEANKNVDSANYFCCCMSKLIAGRQRRKQRRDNRVITNNNLFCRRLQFDGRIDDGNSRDSRRNRH